MGSREESWIRRESFACESVGLVLIGKLCVVARQFAHSRQVRRHHIIPHTPQVCDEHHMWRFQPHDVLKMSNSEKNCTLNDVRSLLEVVAGRVHGLPELGNVFAAAVRRDAARRLLEVFEGLETDEARVQCMLLPLALSVSDAARRVARFTRASQASGKFSSPELAAECMIGMYPLLASDAQHFFQHAAMTKGGNARVLALRAALRRVLKRGNWSAEQRDSGQLSQGSPENKRGSGKRDFHLTFNQIRLLQSLDDHMRSMMLQQISAKLKRIHADASPALLQVLRTAERVHPPADDDDLLRRVGGDKHAPRWCFGLFMPGLESRPLAFVLCAVTQGMPARADLLLAGDDAACVPPPGGGKTAVFYSINNCFPSGTQGLGLGSHLLLSALRQLRGEEAGIEDVVTLSPIPSLARALKVGCTSDPVFNLPAVDVQGSIQRASADAARLTKLVAAGRVPGGCVEHWLPQVRGIWSFWGVRHVLFSRGRGGRRAADPVTNFHASNGASVARINLGGNTSPRGMATSFGVMVNYRYDLQHGAPGPPLYGVEENPTVASTAPRAAGESEPQRFASGGHRRRVPAAAWWQGVPRMFTQILRRQGSSPTQRAGKPLRGAGWLGIASATGYKLAGQLVVSGAAVLLHALSPWVDDSGSCLAWPALVRGMQPSTLRDTQVAGCCARVLRAAAPGTMQKQSNSIAVSDPAVPEEGVLVVVAGGCATAMTATGPASLVHGDWAILGRWRPRQPCMVWSGAPTSTWASSISCSQGSACVLMISASAWRVMSATREGVGFGGQQECKL